MDKQERPTKEQTTASGHKVVYKEWVTKGERLAADKKALQGMQGILNANNTEQVSFKGLGGMDTTAEKAWLETVIVSVNGKTGEEMTNFVLNDIPDWEADEIYKIIDEVTKPHDVKKK